MDQIFLMLEKSNPIAWGLLPKAIERIKKFCVEYGTDIDPDQLASLIQQQFISENPLLLVAVGYKPGKGVFAHALGAIDEITGNRFLTIMQFERDEDVPFADRSEVMRMFEQYKLWGLSNGAKEMQLVTRSPELVKLFELYGFKLHRYLMRLSLMES